MVDLFCTPFCDLIDRMRLEYRNQRSIFDLPQTKWYIPLPDGENLAVTFHDQQAGNPVGPASGPHTQMAQNLVLAWLAGGRIMELKTVQVNDALRIPRPCIDATNVGYNVEWSQELRVQDSLDQYVQGAMLIHMLRHAPATFGHPFGEVNMAGPDGATIYDMSIGYDLRGIRSAKVRNFMEGMIDARATIERWRGLIPARLKALRELEFPTSLSHSVTLSTFHGCPADEIERICEFLLTEVGVHTIVKMNPPMLGRERLEHLLYDVLGYHDIRVNPEAYTNGLQFDESIEIARRLVATARKCGLSFGAKFSNTLEVLNHRTFFPPSEKIMYLSGAPLHVITLALTHQFRQAMGPEIPISFSAGVDRHNFPNLVACGFTPITTCTDLLKPGGYGRLPPYVHELQKAMRRLSATSIADFILEYREQRHTARNDPRQAGFLNTSILVQETINDRRYGKAQNSKEPRRIGSHLHLFDCITCDKCIPVCPNGANFLYRTIPRDTSYHDVQVQWDGSLRECGQLKRFQVARSEQIANFADYCNHCGNCDTFCPEYDGPYIIKPSFFGSRQAFERGAPHDGFLLERSDQTGQVRLRGRFNGQELWLEPLTNAEGFRFCDGVVTCRIAQDGQLGTEPAGDQPPEGHVVDVGRFHAMVALFQGITNPERIHPVNLPWLQPERSEAE